MNYSRYPDYKSSGVEWLGEIPVHWGVKRLKWTVDSCVNGIWGDEADGTDNDIVCVRVADFIRDSFEVSLDNPTLRSVTHEERAGRQIRKDDLLVEKSGGGELQPVGVVVQYHHAVAAVCSNFVAKMTIRRECHSRFLTYFHAHLYRGHVNSRSIKQTTGIQNLDSSSYLSEFVGLPSFEEQRAIAAFLDRETVKIDALIEKKRRFIELLQEKRAALVTRTVTRGLDPHVPLKDSGVEWLGQIPAHWGVKRLKFGMVKIEQGWSPLCENSPADEDQWGVLKVGCVNGDKFDEAENKTLPTDVDPLVLYEIRVGDVLMSRANTRELLGSAALVRDVRPKLLLCDKLYRLRLNGLLNESYLVYVLRSSFARFQFERESTGASGSMQNIGQNIVKELLIPVPPKNEQAVIASRIENENMALDVLRDKVNLVVNNLIEYRATLIAAAVTGKIDVREG